MNEKDLKLYSNFVNQMVNDKGSAVEAVNRLGAMNLDHVRSFTATLLTLNITVIGVVAAAYITNSGSIPYGWIVMMGMIVLFVNSICILFYNAVVLVNENKNLTQRARFLKSSYDTVIDLTHDNVNASKPFEFFDREIYFPKLKEFAEAETLDVKRIEDESWSTSYLYVFCFLLIIGLVLIIAGIYPWARHIAELWTF